MRGERRPLLLAALAATLLGAALLAACVSAELGNREPASGPGPGGKPMRTATETAVGLPAIAQAPVYPLTVQVRDRKSVV